MNMLLEELCYGGTKISFSINDQEVGHVFIYILRNDLHDQPCGYIEDLFVCEEYRQQGFGKEIMRKVIEFAKGKGCYKITATSRFSRESVHKFYEDLGFGKNGFEFRMDLS